ncbi:uncharacterized protein Z518_09233 [Rhinocladiella mackenziei CBS 650.93]|uniref:Phosphoinositide phospholipase C n=1 Tax=Rhinocladiella mackenziei CBS 650.93 TaxID=1442369 RepID=A0A0D2FHT8_9EURO|nr:uncharacterized protein Z518_09233 [Rhinocladiella mackenziei CBS 650.93]KIX01507.1 hypothetical protein Z518_09233 [Rhinocladiella mackenziei CBS 650.93]
MSTRQTLPVRAAGGGESSSTAATFSPAPFSESVLSHLISAHKSLPEDQRSQDGHNFPDEASFLTYMASDKSTAMSAPTGNDLSYPLSAYYISSSHNTYLSGHQLYGDASTDAYTNVLNRGCRCLEIDVWDGGSDSDTSSSEEEDEQGYSRDGRDRSDSKPSRWNRVKARAARMRSRSRSGSLANGGQPPIPAAPVPTSPVQTQSDGSAPLRQFETSSTLNPNYLSPQPSPSLPSKAEPRVLHGYTLTHSVTFRSVCDAIKKSAFVSTKLPLIVSLEVHASLAQQEVMVEIMRDTWAEHLVDITKVSDALALPSPEAVRGKILIKVKWSPNTETGESNNPVEHVISTSTDGTTEDGIATSPEKKKKASKVLTALSELGIYTRAYTFKHFSQPEASIPTHVFSLSENKVHTMHADPSYGPALFDHNKHYLMRVFPKGTRINSSNVDPTFHWRQGAQMVALNWQKMDKGMMLNEGMFAGSGGWVLKPEGYRCNEVNKSEDANAAVLPRKQQLDLEITLLAAQRLPVPVDKDSSHGPKMKPYVKFQLHVDTHGPPGQGRSANDASNAKVETDIYGGEEVDESFYKRRSATYRTDSPDLGGEKVSWMNVPDVVDQLSFFRLKVKDDRSIGKDHLLAWACIRLDRLQSGYRIIHLLDSTGMPSVGAMLVHISKRLT